jgi:hypothetical protein
MRFLLGWMVKLGVMGLLYLAVTGNFKVELPETVLGFEVPAGARQWAERTTALDGVMTETGERFRQISDSFR